MVIDGKKIAEEVLEELKREVEVLRQAQGKSLRLAAVLVGEDPEFEKFVQLKGKAAMKIRVEFSIYQFPGTTETQNGEGIRGITTEELAKKIREVSVLADGVLVELPLPKHIDQQAVLNEIPVEKDVDVLSDKAQGLFYDNKDDPCNYKGHPCCLPPAVEALKIVLEKYGIGLKDKKVAVFGQGALVGKPISHWLEREGAEVFRMRSKTENPKELSLQADIVVAGVGKPGLITGDMVKERAIVIDFGYGKDSDDRMKGDVDFDSVSQKTSLITPVPGGMGPILIAAVLRNLLKLKIKNEKLKVHE